MSKIIIALCLLAIVLFVAAQEAAPAKKGNDLKTKLVQRIKDKVREKLDQRNPKAPAVKLPLKERIANLKEKISKLETKRDQRRAARKAEKKDEKPKSRKPRSDKPKSRKPKSDKPRSRKPKSDKPAKKEKKDQKPKSRKPKSDKPKSRKPRSRKPKSDKPAKEAETESDSEAAAFTLATLQKLFPHLPAAKASAYFPHLEAAMNGAGINTCLRRSAFLAQVGHESGELKWFEEFASGAAYEGRRDLGNTHPGDGKRYKGRGPIQVTGRANYRAAGQALGVDLENNPTWAALPQYGFKVAAWFWNSRSLNGHADKGTQAEFDVITKRINGGYNGKADRDRLWKIARAQLGC